MPSFGYEVYVQPALYVAGAVAVLYALLKGSYRAPPAEEGLKGKFRLVYKAKRRALYTLLGAALVLPAIVITPPGHRAAIYNLSGGVSAEERVEGFSLVVPYVQTARMVNTRTQVYSVEVLPQSLDLQEVTVPVAVNYHVDPEQASELYQDVGLNYETTVIAPAVLQLVTQEVGQFKAIDFALSRAALAKAVFTALEGRLAPYGIVVEWVNLKDAIFAEPFRIAVEAKIIADEKASEQERLIVAEEAKKQQIIKQAEAEAARRKTVAAAEAQAIRDVASALGFTPAEYLDWVRLNRWDGALPKTVLSGDSSSLIFDVGAAE